MILMNVNICELLYCIKMKTFNFSLQVEVMYEDEPLKDYYTLMDIAYIYTWRRVRCFCTDAFIYFGVLISVV